jgi:hypothetical protein
VDRSRLFTFKLHVPFPPSTNAWVHTFRPIYQNFSVCPINFTHHYTRVGHHDDFTSVEFILWWRLICMPSVLRTYCTCQKIVVLQLKSENQLKNFGKSGEKCVPMRWLKGGREIIKLPIYELLEHHLTNFLLWFYAHVI